MCAGVEELCDLDQCCGEGGGLTGELNETSCRSLARLHASRRRDSLRMMGTRRLEPRTRISEADDLVADIDRSERTQRYVRGRRILWDGAGALRYASVLPYAIAHIDAGRGHEIQPQLGGRSRTVDRSQRRRARVSLRRGCCHTRRSPAANPSRREHG